MQVNVFSYFQKLRGEINMPNYNRSSRWPLCFIEDVFAYDDMAPSKLPSDIDKAIDCVLDKILPNQKQIIIWFYMHGYTYDEMIGLNPNLTKPKIAHTKDHGIVKCKKIISYSHNRL